jgi:hypothetical protein
MTNPFRPGERITTAEGDLATVMDYDSWSVGREKEDHPYEATYNVDVVYLKFDKLIGERSYYCMNSHLVNLISDVEGSSPKKCKHEYIPLFNSISCKHCGQDKGKQ